MEEEQSGFREGRGCADQIFTVRCLSEKYLEKHKDIYVAFMDLEKAYDRVDREALWQLFALSLYLSLLFHTIFQVYI